MNYSDAGSVLISLTPQDRPCKGQVPRMAT